MEVASVNNPNLATKSVFSYESGLKLDVQLVQRYVVATGVLIYC